MILLSDVDDGSTVTDFLPAERARGITIQSAAITLHWPPLSGIDTKTNAPSQLPRSSLSHTINLIDTPGHADFTFEVLRSLRILDGAVCILDGVAGVEAQTEKVWVQAHKYKIPRIVFVNKLDRDGAAFERTVKEVGSRLRGWPAVCQIPWWEGGKGRFTGIADAVTLTGLKYEEGGDGKQVEHFSLERLEKENPGLHAELVNARAALVETLCEFDETLLEVWMEHGDDSLAVPPQAIRDSLRRCILNGSGKLIPIYAGASFRNIGVQPLLDAVDDLLPDPTERPDPEISLGDQACGLSDLLMGKFALASESSKKVAKKPAPQLSLVNQLEACALAFKVTNDPKRGVLVYLRVYSGAIKRNASLWNTNLNVAEKAQRLLQMQANDAIEIPEIAEGQIGVIAGLKHARTGDTLISFSGVNPKNGPPAPLNSFQLRPIDVPPPVFFAAIEPHSLSEEKNVQDILTLLLREDPSLHVNVDEESGQMLLSGMGELHLEIARDRLVNDFKAKATMGAIEISYRECALSETPFHSILFDKDIAGKKGKASCEASVAPLSDFTPSSSLHTVNQAGNSVTIDIPTTLGETKDGTPALPDHLTLATLRTSLLNGASAALARGPRRAFPLHDTHVRVKFDPSTSIFGADSSPAAISAAARLAVQAALKDADIGLMEPVMNVIISCDEASLGGIVHDLSSARGGQVLSLDDDPSDSENGQAQQDWGITIDPSRIYAPKDPFGDGIQRGDGPGVQRTVTARVPLKEMVGYLKHLRSITGGRGSFVMSVDRFERLTGVREKAV